MFRNWANDSEVTKYLRWTPFKTIEEARAYLEEGVKQYERPDRYYWVIQIKNGECIGAISVQIEEYDKRADFGYCIGRAFWGNGYMTEAVKAVVGYMFNEIGVNRVEAYHSVNNPASGAVLRKAGMIKEGHAKQKYYSNMGFQDSDLYGLTRDEYFK
jgi:ribosomal-protein-alanine N-acetyltransferase